MKRTAVCCLEIDQFVFINENFVLQLVAGACKLSPPHMMHFLCIFFFSSRALYDRVAETEQDLSFKKDDILYVDDTLPNGNFGTWMAWQLDENAQKMQRGQIPSKYMLVKP